MLLSHESSQKSHMYLVSTIFHIIFLLLFFVKMSWNTCTNPNDFKIYLFTLHSGLKSEKFCPIYFSILLFTKYLFTLFVYFFPDACSSRSTPKPRPPSHSAMRPNITFQTYACPPAYAAWYCLNGATCFTVKIAESILYNCE